MNFVGPKLFVTASQINLATNSVNITTSLPGGRSSYEASQNVTPASVERHDPYEIPIGLEPANLYYLKPTGSNYKIYSNITDAIAGTNAFVFTNTSYFDFVFPKSRRTLSTFSIAKSVGDMYCCETPTPVNSTVLYDRCTVVWEGGTYTLKRYPLNGLSLFALSWPDSPFLFVSDPFIKDDMWHIISIGANYKVIIIDPLNRTVDFDFMTLDLKVNTFSTHNQLGSISPAPGIYNNYYGCPGTQSFSIVTISGGAITGLSNIGTPGYWAVPTITITSTTGTGATAVASVGGGGKLSWTITNGGSGYISAFATVNFNPDRFFELINPTTGTKYWPTSSFPYSGTMTDVDTARALPSVSYSFSGSSAMPSATVVLKGAYFVQTKTTMFPTAFELPNCVTVATSTIALSGLQTIGGVPLQVGDRVLVMGNNSYPDSSKSNGIYLASAGAWSRAGDTFVLGSYTFVNQGTGGKKRYRIIGGYYGTVFPIVYGTTQIVFALYTAADLPITYDNVDLGDVTATCYHDAETNAYYSAVMTLNGIAGRINFGTLGGLPATNRAKFLMASPVTSGTSVILSNDDFNGLSDANTSPYPPFDIVSDPPSVVVPTDPARFFTGLTQSAPWFDTRLRVNGSFGTPPFMWRLRDEDSSRTGALFGVSFSRVGRAVKSIGLPSEFFSIVAYEGDSYISTL